MDNLGLIWELSDTHNLSRKGLAQLLDGMSHEERNALLAASHRVRMEHFGNKVFMRGLLEFTNHCVRDSPWICPWKITLPGSEDHPSWKRG